MMKKWTAVLLCCLTLLSFSACSGDQSNGQGESAPPVSSTDPAGTPDKQKVSVTFDAMAEFAKAVGGDRVEVSTIIPTGTEPHDFEPKAQDLTGLSEANIFVYNGLGMEAWADEAISAASNENLVVVEASQGADAIVNTDAEEAAEHGQYDPHIWLSLKGAELAATNIRDGLVQSDPANQKYYEQNCNDFVAQLESLYQQYTEKFQSVEKKSFVTGHAAFAYLCRDFGLEQKSVEDTFAEGEPTAQQLTELIEYCKANQVTTVFAEEMASPEVSQTLADEVGAAVVPIYTMESAQDGMSYLERMESNLSKIYDSLLSRT